ncbi:2-oxoglutarate dehydrogenase complex dihydrolipoyllysine-residue succinyltransferase [Flammeovirgaceae bacterium SG7u.111]|nr:2-oxoglutarate dehydrogenase complex dihydrolipoyllysine-residue succinyltransferase [Flammeovirgaceae bacterium SG7u.132]WPO34174.1 2-oxoglutarate dehydrogenase complex dihydrolipoyllysine-residue succinyltransferase [Flammeovirgaceae bacterium SG7u.111]
MSFEINVPAVGESITEVTISQWNKQDGDFVEIDEILCELESDKATFELNAEKSGTLKIIAQEGDTIPIGGVICEIVPVEGQASTPAAEEAPEEEAAAPSKTGKVVEMVVPAVGESITEVTVSTWNVENGDYVEIDDVLCELESDKATFELSAEHNGTVSIIASEGETVEIGGLICKVEVMEGGKPAEAAAAAPAEASSNGHVEAGGSDTYASGHASPAAAKILAEKGIAASEVIGTGVDGRVTKEDALKAEKKASAPAVKTSAPAKEEISAPTEPVGDRNERRQKMTSLRKTISKRLVSVKNETAMLTTFNEVDMKPIMDIRKKYKEMFKEKHSVGLGFMSFFTKAVCVALQEWPAVNGKIDGDELVYHDFCDVSIAVSAPKGLVVPVIRNAEQMNFNEIEAEIIRLATRARDNKLTIPEMTGGTFTITNGGVFGSMMSTPIINAPQSAILGMHNIVERPVAINGEVQIRPMMYVALSYDHRIIDGRESVSFLVRVKQLLEDPIRLLLSV